MLALMPIYIRDVLGDHRGLGLGLAGVQGHTLDVSLTQLKQVRERIDWHLYRSAIVTFVAAWRASVGVSKVRVRVFGALVCLKEF